MGGTAEVDAVDEDDELADTYCRKGKFWNDATLTWIRIRYLFVLQFHD